jgi:hypothetical protein
MFAIGLLSGAKRTLTELVGRFQSSNHIRHLEKAHFVGHNLGHQMSGFMESVV